MQPATAEMASDKEKLKRFRVHVVKELFETERDYTQELEFTVAVSCSARLPVASEEQAALDLASWLAVADCWLQTGTYGIIYVGGTVVATSW